MVRISPRVGLGILVLIAAVVVIVGTAAMSSTAPVTTAMLGSPPSASIASAIPASPGAPSPTAMPSGPSDARYPDGLPRTFGGRAVLRGSAALAEAASRSAAFDGTPFLVGGWLTVTGREPGFGCPVLPAPLWQRDCVQPLFTDAAGGYSSEFHRAMTFRYVLDSLEATGAVVAEVRVDDPRSSSCGAHAAACARMMVVQSIVWSGDEQTAPTPLSVASVDATLSGGQPSSTLVPRLPDTPVWGCGSDQLSSAVIEQPRVEPDGTPAIEAVELLPSVAARRRAAPHQPEGAAAALSKSGAHCVADGRWAYSWLAIANVVVMVRIHAVPTAADRAFVIRIADRLTAAAADVTEAPSPGPTGSP